MKRYCISWISFYDNQLKSELIGAESEEIALRKALYNLYEVQDEETEKMNIETLKQFAFDCDGIINAIEIENE